jgi:hypothetical protein
MVFIFGIHFGNFAGKEYIEDKGIVLMVDILIFTLI